MYKNKWKYFCWKHDTGLDRSSTQELILKHTENPRISWIFEHWTLNQSRVRIVLTSSPAPSSSSCQYWSRRTQVWQPQTTEKNWIENNFGEFEAISCNLSNLPTYWLFSWVEKKYLSPAVLSFYRKIIRRTWCWWLVVAGSGCLDVIIQGELSLTFSTVDWVFLSLPSWSYN